MVGLRDKVVKNGTQWVTLLFEWRTRKSVKCGQDRRTRRLRERIDKSEKVEVIVEVSVTKRFADEHCYSCTNLIKQIFGILKHIRLLFYTY